MTSKLLIMALMAAGLLTAGCKDEAAPPTESHPQPRRPHSPPPTVSSSPRRQIGNIRVEPVSLRPVAVKLTVSGKVSFNEDETTPVLSPVAGQVQGLKLKVGDRVSKGQDLMNVKSRDVAAAIDDFLESRKDLDLAEKTYQMTQELFDKQAASKLALQQSQNDLAKAKAKVSRLTQQLRILDVNGDGVLDSGELNPSIPIKSPRDGTIVDRKVSEGQLVQGDGTALMTVADLSSVWVLADVFERDLPLVRRRPGRGSGHAGLSRPQLHGHRGPYQRRGGPGNPHHQGAPAGVQSGPSAQAGNVRHGNPAGLGKPERNHRAGEGRVYGEREQLRVREVRQARVPHAPVKVATADGGRLHVVQGLAANDHVVSEGALLGCARPCAALEGENTED